MLFQEAQKQALQEMQRADADYQTQVRMVQEQRRALQREIDTNRRTVQELQSKQLTINDKRERENQSAINKGIRTSTGSGGSKGPTQITPNVSQVDAFYRKQIGDEQAIIDDIKRDIRSKEQSLDDVRGANENDATSSRGRRKKELLDELDQLNIKLQNAQTNRSLVESERDEFIEQYSSNKSEFDRKYRRLFGAKYQSGGRAAAPTQTTQAVDVEETQLEPVEVDVSPYEERIKELETELGALEMPTRESVDLIPRQSEIYQQYFGRGAAPVDRSAEMDVLGVTPEEPVAVQPSPEVVVEPQPQPEPVVEEPVVEEPQPRTYTVQPGDTLSQISQDVYGTPSRFMDIAEASGVQDPDVIREGQELTVPPSPTPTLSDNREALNRIRALRLQPQRLSSIGRRMRLDDMQQPTAVESQQSTLKQKFEAVANQHPNQKKLLAMQLLQEYARDLGVTSPEYAKAKKQVLQQLQQSLDPAKARQLKKIRKNQEESPGNYYNLGAMVSGVVDKVRNLVSSLFPVSDDTRVDEIESLYKNAQQQIRLAIKDKIQKRKALELLDLQYLAVLEDKR
jgi:LysM repeat protein